MDEKLIAKIEQKAKKYFVNLSGSHGWDHVERVAALCDHIGKVEKADLKTLGVSALLHDIGREEEFKAGGKICHAKKGATIAKDILNDIGFCEKDIKKITHCIETHRFRGQKKPDSKEAKILSDADNLDAMGAIGVARYLYFACAIGAKIHNTKGTDVLNTKEYSKEDTAYREYLMKHKEFPKRMYTNEGKRLAKERLAFMKIYFDRLIREAKGKL